MPYDQSGDVYWSVDKKISGSLQATRKAEENGKLAPGESYYAVPTFANPDNKPTLESWAQDLKDGQVQVPEQHRGARPPTAEELAALDSK